MLLSQKGKRTKRMSLTHMHSADITWACILRHSKHLLLPTCVQTDRHKHPIFPYTTHVHIAYVTCACIVQYSEHWLLHTRCRQTSMSYFPQFVCECCVGAICMSKLLIHCGEDATRTVQCMYVCICTCVHVYICIHMQICHLHVAAAHLLRRRCHENCTVYVCMCVYVYACVHMCACVCIYIYIYMHIYKHTHRHTDTFIKCQRTVPHCPTKTPSTTKKTHTHTHTDTQNHH